MATPRFSPGLFPVPAAPTRRIGKYDVQAEIGSGTVVKVFRAFDRALLRPVTLKVLTERADAALMERFRAEVATAGKLHSESFIGIYDLAEESGRPFAAMQVMGDDDLDQAIRSRRPLTLLQKLLILWQVAEGVRATHAGGLRHVGLRPSGIALDESGRAIVQDFGTVRGLPAADGDAARYRAPEETGDELPDALCDIFSFGVIAGELLPGGPLEPLVQRATAPNRSSRYQSIEELQEDLEPILGEVKHKRCISQLGDAAALINEGKLEQVQPLLKEVLHLEPDNRKALRMRTELRTLQQARASERKQRLDRQLAEAAALVASERYNRAIVVLCDLSREFRGDAEIARLLDEACELRARQEATQTAADACDALLREGSIEKAVELLDGALTTYPGDPLLTARRQQIEEQRRELQSAAEAQKVLDEVQWVLDQGRPDLAAQLLRDKSAANPRTELALRLSEIESMLPRWQETRFVAETLPRVAALEELQQWTVALTVLEEGLQQYPGSRDLQEAAERLRSRLSGEERRRKLARRLDSIGQKMNAQAWAQALMLIEAAQEEFPGEPELERLRQSAEEARRRADGESIVNLVRQCLEDGEPERAEELLKKGLALLPADARFLGLQQEVNAGKQYREEWRTAQVLFGRRQFLDAEKLLARLAANHRPEVDLLLQTVREARAATEEDNFYASGRAKAVKLIEQGNLDQAADLLRNLLSLFPGDVILQRDLQSISASVPVTDHAEPAKAIPFIVPADRTPRAAHRRLGVAAAGILLVASSTTAIWKMSHGDAPAPPPSPIVIEPARIEPVLPAPAPIAQTPAPETVEAPRPQERVPAPTPAPVAQSRFRREFSPPPAAGPEKSAAATLTVPPAVASAHNGDLPALPERALGASHVPAPPPAPVPAPAAPPPAPVPRVGGNAEIARLVSGPPPVIPAIARQTKVGGVVTLRAIVGTQGYLKNIEIVSGSPLLRPAALEAVRKWRYRPAMLNGSPVESKVDIRMSFQDR